MTTSRRTFPMWIAVGLFACGSNPVLSPTSTPERGALDRGEGDEASDAAHRDLRPVRDSLLSIDLAYAAAGAQTNLIEALVAPLAHDGVFLAPGPGFARGPAEARAILEANPANLTSKWRWMPIRVDVSSDGQHGYTYGYTELELQNGTVLPGRYQSFWARQTDGSWKIAAYRRSPRAPGAVSLVPPPGFETPTTIHRRYFPNTDPATEALAVAAADRAFSDLAQQVSMSEAFATYAAPDGAQSGGAVAWAFGREEIAAAHAGEPAGLFSWAPEIVSAASSGDLAWSIGFVYQGAVIVGKYFTIWQKQNTGNWLYVAD